ncbi:MAG: FAD-dependent oxidoreductase [Candidatus Lokiarchaeota archaeon]|nr:FAD-dependent oxidoreductase [Candidatus Lokiarchaeota archaeon]MBD3200654.1 FAD-dependent oxidoreductase [Candidatus Lokiarchaeota archaeon]
MENQKKIRVGIIGAGSAGLFAANELGKELGNIIEIKIFEAGPPIDKRICPQNMEYECAQCDPCRIMSGVGGAGAWSSGILNLNKNIGGDLDKLCSRININADDLINEIDRYFVKNGAPNQVFDPRRNKDQLKALKRKCAAVDIRFIPIKQRLLGSKNTPKVIKNIRKHLESEYDIKIHPNMRVLSFDKNRTLYFEKAKKETFDYLLVAPGRWGMMWLAEQCETHGIKTYYKALDIGVRIEVPSIIMEEICEQIQRDPKFHIITPTYNDFIRTFCVNHKGYVVKENYEENIVGVNGHQISIDGESENSNFAFLIRQKLTRPLEDTTKYGRSISLQTSILGGYKPLVQTLGDLKNGHRSRLSLIKRNPVQPTLKDATPGDIAMAYPYRFITDILEGLEILDKVIPGVNNKSTLIYAPEFKRSAKRIETNKYLESKKINNIFFAGDGAGLSRGIIAAAVTGKIAAKGIISKIQTH